MSNVLADITELSGVQKTKKSLEKPEPVQALAVLDAQ
jgi:hypothetical protein